MDESLVALVALWRELSVTLTMHPDSASLTAEAQRVGSQLLAECRRHGIDPVLALLVDGEARG